MAASASKVPGVELTAVWRMRLAIGLMVASGFAALGYQIVWTQQSALWLGHEAAAVLAVITAFFGGLAVGALALGPPIDRSRHPARWYAACEAAIGLWGVALAFFMAPVSEAIVRLIGAEPAPAHQWAVAFCSMFVLLLPATAAMGATMPAMERVLAQMPQRGSSIAVLYAANTAGAVLGVLGAAFWLVPAFGLLRTAVLCMALNLLCALAALQLFVRASPPQATAPSPMPAVLPLLAVTGLLGIGYEVLVVRVLSQVAENTVYTFAILLAVYLIGTALGAALYQRWLPHPAEAERVQDRLLRWLSAACLIGVAGLAGADLVKASVLHLLGPSMAAALMAEAAISIAAFLPPTIIMGAVFSHLATGARATGIPFGRALGVNTLGAAAAPLVFGVVLVPWLGAKASLLIVAVAYLLLSARRSAPASSLVATTAATLALALWAPPLTFIDVPPGGRVVSLDEGVMAAVSVVEDADGVARLHINNRQQEGSSATLLADARQALLPMMLHPAPRRALFLGLGTGVTASSAAQDPTLEVDAVELLPEVVTASVHFTRGLQHADGSRLNVITADARRFVRASRTQYDLIVADNFHPARQGSGSLYTVEHFEAVRERLASGGVFCQWLPLHQLDIETLRSIVRSFVAVHPGGWAMLATNSLHTPVVGLVAIKDAQRFDPARVTTRIGGLAGPRGPVDFGIADDLSVLGSFIAGAQSLASFAAAAPLNTDDHPVVAYRAPRLAYASDSKPRERLTALLRELTITPDELVAHAADNWTARLSAYWRARDRYIEIGLDVRASADVRRMLSQVREPLLSVLRISPDFRPAYDPLLRMATALAPLDAAAARALLTDLQRAQPARAEAASLLRDPLGGSP